MKMNKLYRAITVMFAVVIVLGLVSVQAQDNPEPVVYEGLTFPELPYVSRWVEVNGAKMHYIEGGDPTADPILFLHGQPTWSYLWRNVMPHLEDQGRVIAVDLIGMGRSDRPDIEYRYRDHIEYLEGFINAMELSNITLVVHDWGSSLGFDYASRHEDNVSAIAFMESIIPPFPFESYEAMPLGFGEVFQAFRTPGMGEEMIMNQSMFIEQIVPASVMRELTEEEMNAYRVPYPTPEDRVPIWRWPNELPIAGEPADTFAVVTAYIEWMEQTDVPMLHIYVTPGASNPEASVEWSSTNIQNIETMFMGEGIHFIQEDHPDEIGQAIAEWLPRALNN